MTRPPALARILPIALLLLACGKPSAEGEAETEIAPLQIAVASNFVPTMKALVEAYTSQSTHEVVLSAGSTGKHYAQILNGAPFDLFFAADVQRPTLLEEQSRAHSRFTYAIGQLVLWTPQADVELADQQWLQSDFNHFAIANPKLAPYGLAAQQVLQKLGLWQQLEARLVRGENIGQTFQFVQSGNAELGLVAYAQLLAQAKTDGRAQGASLPGSWWLPALELYDPIEQQAVQLSDHVAAADFLAFVRSVQGRKIIISYGYGVPDQ
ncbi:MAG: molybdate ABC transporter substrate-binding protein [Planctomycetes bacterium]|nr:molybdate ABC transporter substrate-binding protein [Planctomycetota bacterium]